MSKALVSQLQDKVLARKKRPAVLLERFGFFLEQSLNVVSSPPVPVFHASEFCILVLSMKRVQAITVIISF